MPLPHALWRALMLSTALLPALAHAEDEDAGTTVAPVVVTAPASVADLSDLPNTTSTVTAAEIARTVSVVTPEDTIRYLPNVLIRQRHIGDTQSPITTRTSGVGASARSLIYVDGMLISSLIGNNNTSASPKWGLITPNAVERVDVLNGPFAAAFAGNSIGSVISFHTRTPTAFEARVEAQASGQGFSKYGDDDTYGTWRIAGDLGDRRGPLALRLSYNHLDSHSQPLTYVTAPVPPRASTAGTPVSGAFDDHNRLVAAIKVLGGSGLEHQVQDNASSRLSYDLTADVTLAYTFGLFANEDDATVTTYLRDGSGAPVYSGPLNIGGRLYNVAASAFSNGVYRFDELQLAQGLSLSSHTGGAFDFDLTATLFDYLKSRQRIPTAALPGAFAGGPGTVAKLDDTGWYTLDADGKWRPGAGHAITLGLHQDRFRLSNPRYSLTDWRHGDAGTRIADSQGRTRTRAVWAQDDWRATRDLRITLGGRWEHWRAYDGLNFSAAPALNVPQPRLSHDAFSPKGVAAWSLIEGWTLKGSLGVANRFPTVSELSLERRWTHGEARIALFDERIRNTLISQSGTLNNTTVNFVQNVPRTRATGFEVVARQDDVLVKGLQLSGWVTYLDTEVEKDPAFPAAVGKRLPQLPRWRGAFVATYSGVPKLDVTLAARYSDRAFGTLDNSDPYANTYQGFGAYFVVDAHARYAVTDHVTASLGVTNLLDRKYFLFHPFPQRSVVADLTYSF